MAKKSEYQKQITKINERMAAMYYRYGGELETYKNMVAYINSISEQRNEAGEVTRKGIKSHESAKGYKAISQSEKGFKLTKEQIGKLLSYKTVGQLEKTTKEDLKRFGIEDPTEEEVKRFTTMYGDFHQFIEDHRGEIYAHQKTMDTLHNAHGRISIDEMIEITERFDKPADISERHDVFENNTEITKPKRRARNVRTSKRKR